MINPTQILILIIFSDHETLTKYQFSIMWQPGKYIELWCKRTVIRNLKNLNAFEDKFSSLDRISQSEKTKVPDLYANLPGPC